MRRKEKGDRRSRREAFKSWPDDWGGDEERSWKQTHVGGFGRTDKTRWRVGDENWKHVNCTVLFCEYNQPVSVEEYFEVLYEL